MDRVSKAECELVRKMQRQTNADKYFRNATDEELAQIIAADWCELLICVGQGRRCDQQCETRILDWLKQEVESDA